MQSFSNGLSLKLRQQLTFLLEINWLKGVFRQSRLLLEDRRENSVIHRRLSARPHPIAS